MVDLVERLQKLGTKRLTMSEREVFDKKTGRTVTIPASYTVPIEEWTEAADEILRLRADLAEALELLTTCNFLASRDESPSGGIRDAITAFLDRTK